MPRSTNKFINTIDECVTNGVRSGIFQVATEDGSLNGRQVTIYRGQLEWKFKELAWQYIKDCRIGDQQYAIGTVHQKQTHDANGYFFVNRNKLEKSMQLLNTSLAAGMHLFQQHLLTRLVVVLSKKNDYIIIAGSLACVASFADF